MYISSEVITILKQMEIMMPVMISVKCHILPGYHRSIPIHKDNYYFDIEYANLETWSSVLLLPTCTYMLFYLTYK